MGNKLGCSCGTVPRKGYRCEDAPISKQVKLQQQSVNHQKSNQNNFQKREGQIMKLWAEVNHLAIKPGGENFWEKLNEDIVPVNISCIKDTPTCCQFQITAYNTMIDKILDVQITQPGTTLVLASESFVRWKDIQTGETWGLNFTSALDARNFIQICSPFVKTQQKASRSYSLKLGDQQNKKQLLLTQQQQQQQQQAASKRKPQSTPSSPSARRAQLAAINQMNSTGNYPLDMSAASQQCTCMAETNLQYRNGREIKYAATSTLPKSMFRQDGRLIAYPSSNNSITSNKTPMQSNTKQVGQIQKKVQSGPIRSRPNTQPMLTKAQLQQQQKIAMQQQLCRAAACNGVTKYTPSINICDARCKSKSSDDIRKSVSTGTEDLLMESRSVLTAQNTSHNARRLHLIPTRNQGMPIPKVSGYQSDHGNVPTRRMQTTGTNTTCTIPNCNAAHRSRVSSYGQAHQPRPTSVPNWNFGTSEDSADVDFRSRSYRSESGRRKSLERTACVDYTDQSPPSDTYMLENLRKIFNQQQQSHNQQNQQSSISNQQMMQQNKQMNGLNATTPTPTNSNNDPAAAMAAAVAATVAATANSVKQSANRKTIQQNLNALLNNKIAEKLFNDFAIAAQQQSKQNSDQLVSSSIKQHSNQQINPPQQSSQQYLQNTQSSQQAGTNSPTFKALQERENHLRNILARGNSSEIENYPSLKALVSQSLENVVCLMRDIQNELDAIQLEKQQYRAEQAENEIQNQIQNIQASSGRQSSQDFKNSKNYWSRSHTLPSRHSLSVPMNINKQQNSNVSNNNVRLGSTYHNASLGFGLNKTGLLSGSDLCKEIKKRSSTPFLDTISMENLAYFTGGWKGQASFESTDSRANLTWSEVSDEDELAISDEDGDLLATGRSFAESPFRQAKLNATLQCIGAVRKAGFLFVKKWLLRKPAGSSGANVELARKRGWKSYWVCLKGTTLLFYQCDGNGPISSGNNFDSKPKHLIILDGSLILPIPEHPKRDFVFCLSTAFGDAYLFQAPCQLELDSWTTQIHCACGAAFARHRGKAGTVHLLEEKIFKLQKKLEQEAKSKHMSELQLSVITDVEMKRSLQSQIREYELKLEQYFIEQFRLRSYAASINEQEQPNPKTLLTRSSKQTKSLLNNLGVFNVSSLHAHICASSASYLNSVMNNARTSGIRRRASSSQLSRHSSNGSRPNSAAGYGQVFSPNSYEYVVTLQILFPNEELPVPVKISALDTVEDLFWQICNERSLTSSDHYLQCKRIINGECYVPHRTETIKQHHLDVDLWRVCQKTLYQVELCRNSIDQLFGFSVEAELVEAAVNQNASSNLDSQNNSNPPATGYDELSVYVSRVEENSLAAQQQLCRGDEIMVINGNIVSELDMMYIESVLQEELSLCMMLRSCRDLSQTNHFDSIELAGLSGVQASDEYIESLVCPPPPADVHISDEMIGKLIAPPPTKSNLISNNNFFKDNISEAFPEQSQDLTAPWPELSSLADCKNTFELLHSNIENTDNFVKKPSQEAILLEAGSLDQVEPIPNDDETDMLGVDRINNIPSIERLKRAINELVDTEKSYVNHLNSLVQLYLEPMQKLNLLSASEAITLFHNIQDIIVFQRELLSQLNQVLSRYNGYLNFTNKNQFSDLLCQLARIFTTNAEKFKLYCKFCANHSKAMKALKTNRNSNHKLIDFLTTSSRGEHASSLESYLIKPIQRILKYPLLLEQLKCLTQLDTVEREHLSLALFAMESVAGHINEMQRIHEEYGAIFEHLQQKHYKLTKQHIQLSTSELNHSGEVLWQNVSEFLGKMKKNLDLYAVCFVFQSAVVFVCKERIRQKKKLGSNPNKSNEVEIIRYQILLPVREVHVRPTTSKNVVNTNTVPDGDNSFNSNTENSTLYNWELIHSKCNQSGSTHSHKEKVYQLANITKEEKVTFLRHLYKIIRESVRKMGLPSTKITSSLNNGAYKTLHAFAKHQLITAVAATGTELNTIETDVKKSSNDKNLQLKKNDDNLKEENKVEESSNKKNYSHILVKQQSSSSGDFPAPPEKKIPPKPPQRKLSNEQDKKIIIKPKQQLGKTNSGRTFEKQQTITEKSSPPLCAKDKE